MKKKISLRKYFRKIYSYLYEKYKKQSILVALKEQELYDLYLKLIDIVPDISQQYTSFVINDDYYYTKVKAQHAFQISMVLKSYDILKLEKLDTINLIDIGDSAGTHNEYISKLRKNIKTLSINLDNKAIEKIKAKGMNALLCKAEDIEKYNVHCDIFTSFQMLEHLHNPIQFLKDLSNKSQCKAFVVTVPYVVESRVSINYIRFKSEVSQNPEGVHIFELSPDDWKIIFKFSGWEILEEKIYLQYPKNTIYRYLKKAWKLYDFEGFYGVILIKNDKWEKLYKCGDEKMPSA